MDIARPSAPSTADARPVPARRWRLAAGSRAPRPPRAREAAGRSPDDRRRGLEVDRGRNRLPLRPHRRPAAAAGDRADPHRRGAGDLRRAPDRVWRDRGAVDRRRHRRTWRPPRPHRRQPGPRQLARHPGRGPPVPVAAAAGPRSAADCASAAGIAGGCLSLVGDLAVNRRHARRSVSAEPRDYGPARSRRAALPPALLLPCGRGLADRHLAGADRVGARPRRQAHRRPPSLARPGEIRQGAGRHAAQGDGRPPRERRPLRHGARCDGGWRRDREDAVAPAGHARFADGRRTLGQSPRRPGSAFDAAPALRRPRRRPGRPARDGAVDRTGRGDRDRGADAVAGPGRLQRGSAQAQTRHAPRCDRSSWNGSSRKG